MDSKMATRERPLDISYSLRIGTSIYHVLGQRRGGRKDQYDYYVMDEKFIRSQSNRKPSRPRYIVDKFKQKKKSPPKPPPIDVEAIKKVVNEALDAERERIVEALRAAVSNENEPVHQAIRSQSGKSADLIERTVKETIDAQKKSAAASEEANKRELERAKRKAREEEEERMNRLFEEQKQVIIDTLNQQLTATLPTQIKAAVAESIQAEKGKDKPLSQEDLKQMEARLNKNIEQVASKHRSIKLINDIDMAALPLVDQSHRHKKDDAPKTSSPSFSKDRRPSIDSPTDDQPEISHKRPDDD